MRYLGLLIVIVLTACNGEIDEPHLIEPVAVVLTPTDTAIRSGDTVRIRARVTDNRGVEILNPEIRWSSSDTIRATVDQTGLVRMRTHFDVIITARAGSANGIARVFGIIH